MNLSEFNLVLLKSPKIQRIKIKFEFKISPKKLGSTEI